MHWGPVSFLALVFRVRVPSTNQSIELLVFRIGQDAEGQLLMRWTAHAAGMVVCQTAVASEVLPMSAAAYER